MKTKKDAVRRFVDTYIDDASAICFAWNGKHGDQFEDANEPFRSSVIDCVINESERAPLAILVDLYRALTEYSTEAWCIDDRVEDIAKLMLYKGRGRVARDYIIGAHKSFDAHSATLFAGCPTEVAAECLGLANSKLQSETTEYELDVWQAGVERFGVLLKHST